MTYREAAVMAWSELGWSEERIKEEIAFKDKHAAEMRPSTYKEIPKGTEREVIEVLKMMQQLPVEEKQKRFAVIKQCIAERNANN